MNIRLNGEAYSVPPGTTLLDVVKRLSLREDQVAVERNREVVRRAELHRTPVQEGDRVEVVHFVGGG
ncbi:MAG: sulfur carrier protein ThiS [Acidobacteria bacterium]|nr:sulfur carrier protein ThiS [Acidobacteriota bacterium]